MAPVSLVCPQHRQSVLSPSSDGCLVCPVCGRNYPAGSVVDMMDTGAQDIQTANHYTKQWGKKLGMGERLKDKSAQKYTVSHLLPWGRLFEEIRSRAFVQETFVYDAACGWGGIFCELFAEPVPPLLRYVGADIHGSLSEIEIPAGVEEGQALFMRWDISDPLPVSEAFDYVLCRASVHHTPDPLRTLGSLAKAVRKAGKLAISVYTRKTPMREAVDDTLRRLIIPLPSEEALVACEQLAILGRDLRDNPAQVTISQDLPFLGIKAGEYGIQEFIYDHLLKCWFNSKFGLEHSTVVNFDWYHPEFAFRYSLDEIVSLVEQTGLRIVETATCTYQHYLEATKA